MVFVKSSKHMQHKNLLPSTITHNIRKKKRPGNVNQSTEEFKMVACSIMLYIIGLSFIPPHPRMVPLKGEPNFHKQKLMLKEFVVRWKTKK